MRLAESDEQQRAEHARRLLELARVAVDRAEQPERAGVLGVHGDGGLELALGLVFVLHGRGDQRELGVHLGALRRLAPAVLLEQAIEDRPRWIERAGRAERVGEDQPRDAIVRRHAVGASRMGMARSRGAEL